MTQNPTYCSKCHTTRPPLLAGRTYTCVMCGKTRSPEEYRTELAKLRRAAEKAARGGASAPLAAPANNRPPAPPPAAKATPAPAPAEPAAKTVTAKKATAKKPATKKSAAAPAPKKAAAAAEGTPCAWKDCDQIARPKSKYCSRTCSNKNARYRHAKRRTEPTVQRSA